MKLQSFLNRIIVTFVHTNTSTIAEVRSAATHKLLRMTTGPACDTPDKLASLLSVVAHETSQLAQREPEED